MSELTIRDESAKAYLGKPYSRVVIPEDDGSYRAEMMEFPGCIAVGDTGAQALESLEDTAVGWILSVLERGQAVPAPFESNNEYSGKLVLRIPKSLHRKAARYAEREGVSLNQFIVYSLAESVGERRSPRGPTVVFYPSVTVQHYTALPPPDRIPWSVFTQTPELLRVTPNA